MSAEEVDVIVIVQFVETSLGRIVAFVNEDFLIIMEAVFMTVEEACLVNKFRCVCVCVNY